MARASGWVRGSGPRTAPVRSARRSRAPPSPSAGPPGSTSPSSRTDLRVPETVPLCRHLGEAAPGEDALRPRAHDVHLVRRTRVLVLVLHEEPGLRVVPLDLDERPLARELLAVELELQLSLLHPDTRIDHGRPGPAVPEHDRPRPVFALRDHTLEGAVLDRMVLDVHRESLVARVEGRALRHGPAQQNTVQLQPEVVVEPRRRVLLDAVGRAAAGAHLGGRLGGLGEVAFLLVVLESHPGECAVSARRPLRPRPRSWAPG